MSFRVSLAALLFTSFFLTGTSTAEVKVKGDIFANIVACDAYTSFLKNETTEDYEDCHPLAKFQIANNHAGLSKYLRDLTELGGENSALGSITQSLYSAMRGRAIDAYQFSELANQRITLKMWESRDIERAVLYSHLLTEIQRMSVLNLCRADANCDTMARVSSISSLFGSQLSYIDQIRSDFVLLCLLRTDGFILPIRTVLNSEKFQTCVSNPR